MYRIATRKLSLTAACGLLAGAVGCTQDFKIAPADCVDQDADFYCAEVDCDDSDLAVNPGAYEIWYDGVDQNCDGNDDDFDQDGVGIAEDCDDENPAIHPGADEIWYDGVDADCAGDSDYDADGDGYDNEAFGGTGDGPLDCDDTDPSVYPGAPDSPADKIDSDCDGEIVIDADGDGYAPAGGAAEGDPVDCDDTDPAINPGATEVWYDGVDADCDGASDYDADSDSHDADTYGGDDCDDTDADINPDQSELWYDGVDEDCDGRSDYDQDYDSYLAAGYGAEGDPVDCDDTDAAIFPGAPETWYDGVDTDCGGGSDYDQDLDGYDYDAFGGGDCDDTDAGINPSASEVWYDGVDSDCAGDSDYDADADGFLVESAGGDDCDDTDASVNPGASETWYDGVDGDCAGGDDNDADADGYDASITGGDDCDDGDAAIYPGAVETLGDGDDGDCDGDANTAEFVNLLLYSTTDLSGPRLSENDDGVVVGGISEDVFGYGSPGSIWHFLDPAAPWDGAIDVDGWYYTGGTIPSFGRAYDLVADGSYVVEFLRESYSLSTQIRVIVTDRSAGGATVATGLLTSDTGIVFSDIHASFDGSTIGVVYCEQHGTDWLVYMEGSAAEFYSDAGWGYSYSTGDGGDACASRVSQSDMLVSSSANNRLIDYSHNGVSNSLSATSSTATTRLALDYALDGSADLLAYVSSGGTLTLDDGGASDLSAVGTVETMRASYDGTEGYAIYINTSNELYLVWGNPGSGLSYVQIDPGWTAGVSDADVLVTSAGTLVIAARGPAGEYGVMALAL